MLRFQRHVTGTTTTTADIKEGLGAPSSTTTIENNEDIHKDPITQDKAVTTSKPKLKSMVGMITKFSRVSSAASEIDSNASPVHNQQQQRSKMQRKGDSSSISSMDGDTFVGAAEVMQLDSITEDSATILDHESDGFDDGKSVESVSSLGVGSAFSSPVKQMKKGHWKKLNLTGRFVGSISGKAKLGGKGRPITDFVDQNVSSVVSSEQQMHEFDNNDDEGKENSMYSEGSIPMKTFSAGGFRVNGSSTRAAALQGSMLGVLRAYSSLGMDSNVVQSNGRENDKEPPSNPYMDAFGPYIDRFESQTNSTPARKQAHSSWNNGLSHQSDFTSNSRNDKIEEDGMLSALRSGFRFQGNSAL